MIVISGQICACGSFGDVPVADVLVVLVIRSIKSELYLAPVIYQFCGILADCLQVYVFFAVCGRSVETCGRSVETHGKDRMMPSVV